MGKILVIDDDRSIVQMLQLLLSSDGHTVSVASDGKMGLTMVRSLAPDLIILDVMMPEMDGFGVSSELFKDPELRKIPVLIMTAKGHTRDIFSLVPNVSLHIEKPFDPMQFKKSVAKLLAK